MCKKGKHLCCKCTESCTAHVFLWYEHQKWHYLQYPRSVSRWFFSALIAKWLVLDFVLFFVYNKKVHNAVNTALFLHLDADCSLHPHSSCLPHFWASTSLRCRKCLVQQLWHESGSELFWAMTTLKASISGDDSFATLSQVTLLVVSHLGSELCHWSYRRTCSRQTMLTLMHC